MLSIFLLFFLKFPTCQICLTLWLEGLKKKHSSLAVPETNLLLYLFFADPEARRLQAVLQLGQQGGVSVAPALLQGHLLL